MKAKPIPSVELNSFIRMYNKILLPTDGSPGAEAAIDHAMHVANQNDAVVHAVHVIEITDLGDITEETEDLEAELRESSQELLTPILDAADNAEVEVVEAVIEGRPYEQLVEYVTENAIDMVVMGSHGKSGLSRVLLGSTAEKVVRHSPVPVLTVRTREDSGS